MHYQRVINPNNSKGMKKVKENLKVRRYNVKRYKRHISYTKGLQRFCKLKKSKYLYILSFIQLDQNSKVAVTMYGTN